MIASTKPTGVKKSVKVSAPLKLTANGCTAEFKLKLPKKFKGKKIKIKLSFAGNSAYQIFAKTVSYKVK